MALHEPVLVKEILELLVLNKNGVYFDGTLGFGGHSSNILNLLSVDGRVLATDLDENATNFCRELFKDEDRIKIYTTRFNDINIISKLEFIEKYDGVLADLGVSSFQLDNSSAGFSYRQESLLDLRMDKSKGETAAHVVNTRDEAELTRIFKEFGEERFSKKIANNIIRQRKISRIKTTSELREIIEQVMPHSNINKTLSRIFQALRIFINDELGNLSDFLDRVVDLLNVGGRVGIISFHSLEDRIVKEKFKYETLKCICPPESPICICEKKARLKLITKKPITASPDELRRNSRSRSAKLRVAERI